MGCFDAIPKMIVRRHCAAFWTSLILSLILSALGGLLLIRRVGGFSSPSNYDWLVASVDTVEQYDVNVLTNALRSGASRRLSHHHHDNDDDDDDLVEDDSNPSLRATRRLDEETGPERSRYANGNATMTFIYETSDGTNIFTPERLRSICEAENVILGHPTYGEVCYDGSAPKTTGADGRNCSLPRSSILRYFYVDWTPYVAADWASASTAAKVQAELYLGVAADSGGYPSEPTTAFTSTGTHNRTCSLLPAAYVTARANWLMNGAATRSDVRSAMGSFLAPSALTEPSSAFTRSYIYLGEPVAGCAPTKAGCVEGELKSAYEAGLDTYWADQSLASLFSYYGMSQYFLHSAFRDPAVLHNGGVRVRFSSSYWLGDEFGDIINGDFLMVAFSVVFVLIYMCIHMQSLALGLLGILMIILSLPMALFFYLIFGVEYFAQVHILAVFIVLGVGADDVFVFMDAWRQSASMPPPISGSYETRMKFAYGRCAQAVFNTSFTTAIAFLTSAVSPVMPVASFGYFAALAILMNYLLVVTFFPAAVMVWEVYFRRAAVIGCCLPCIPLCSLPPRDLPYSVSSSEIAAPAVAPEERNNSPSASLGDSRASPSKAAETEVDLPRGRLAERLFGGLYAPTLNYAPLANDENATWAQRSFKPVSLFFVVALLATGGYLLSRAAMLTPPTREEVWFPNDHMITGLEDLGRENFISGAANEYESGKLYFGIDSIARPKYNIYKPDLDRGEIVYSPNFDLSTLEAQAAFKQVCATVVDATCGGSAGCSAVADRLVQPSSVRCWLDDFDARAGAVNATVGAAFLPAVIQWVSEDGSRANLVGLVDGELKYSIIRFATTLIERSPPSQTREVYNAWQTYLNTVVRVGAPPGLVADKIFVIAGRQFAWMVTQERLVTGLFMGLAISGPVAFTVLLLATKSFLVALYAIISIAMVVTSLLGTCYLLGWELGISEAIAGTIVIGLAVDYTVHLGHVYTCSSRRSRESKMTEAASIMGVTVIAGAITTFGCACFMFACQLTFFTKMATLMGGTIGYSVLYSLFLFMPLCALIGPSGEIKSWGGKIRSVCGGGKSATGTLKPPRPANTQETHSL